MVGSLFPAPGPVAKIVAPIVAAVVIAGGGIGYAAHEYNNAQTLATENEQTTAQLVATRLQLDALIAKVDDLTQASQASSGTDSQMKPTHTAHSAGRAASRRASTRREGARNPRRDSRFDKLQSQVDAQGKEIDATRSDLTNTRTELTGSIAKTHDELELLEKKGERSYFEFDLAKTKEFKREGPLSMSLRKANIKHGYADLALIVDDRNLQQKHVNLYQPAMFYEPDSQMPVEVVINDISKDHIHGYVSAPKYRPDELAAMSNASANQAARPNQSTNSSNGDNGVVGQPADAGQVSPGGQPELRQRLPLPAQSSS